MDPRVIKKTQDTLGKIIKKPPLTEKLLNKPPFRFLHDIMTSVIKTTGFMKGLYTEEELNSENVKDKDSKIAFLQKAVDFTSMVTGKSLSVKPGKVVAGHEPEKTNEFLQALAAAINKGVDSDEYVQKMKNGGGEPKEEKSKEERDSRKKRDSEEKRDREKSASREKSRDRHRDRKEGRERDSSREGREERHKDKEERHRDKEDRHKDKEDRHRDREDREDRQRDRGEKHKDREERKRDRRKANEGEHEDESGEKKQDIDQIAISDMKTNEGMSKSDVTDQDIEKLEQEMAETSRFSRANRPGAARPRASRHAENKASVENIAKKEGIVLSTLEDDAGSPSTEKKIEKKRKSGTKSRMAVRKSEESSPALDEQSPKAIPRKTSRIPLSYDYTEQRKKERKLKQSQGSPKDVDFSRNLNKKEKQLNRKSVDGRKKMTADHNIYVSPQHHDDESKENEPAMMNGEKEESPTKLARPSSAKGSRRRREGRRHDSDEEDEPPKSMQVSEERQGDDNVPPQVSAARGQARPSSARPAPPRRKQDTIENEPAMRLGSGKPANVIVDDGKDDSDDDDEGFMVAESAPPAVEPDQPPVSRPEDDDDEDHGGLVKKMLETKKELETGSQVKKTEIERPKVNDAQRMKERQVVQKEIDKLQVSIQTLTRSANPLGKIMDYVQEDLDSMQKELSRWKSENKEHALELKRERSITDKAIEPLRAQLAEVDQAIKDQLDLIAATKCNIMRNDQKIEKMLRSIATS